MSSPSGSVGRIGRTSGLAQRACAECEEDERIPSVHAKREGNAALRVDASQIPTSGGAPLHPLVRREFEPRLGFDLSGVRIHNDAASANSARSLNALAYAAGNHLVFAPGQYSPTTSAGRRLLAHELTHVIQQGAARPRTSAEHEPARQQASAQPAQMIQCTFEDDPISSGSNSDTLVTRIQGILREWKSECQEGVNDFVHAELAASIDSLGSGSWPSFLVALIGNTIWAATAFIPVAAGARVIFAVSMAGIAVNATPSIPAASSQGANLVTVSDLLKDYFGNVFTQLMNDVSPTVREYVRVHGQETGNQALMSYLRTAFRADEINTSGTPNINGNAIRRATHAHASDLLRRYQRQVVPLGSATTTNVTDPADRQITAQTGLVWARHPNGSSYLAQISISNSTIGGRLQRGTQFSFFMFVDEDLQAAATERALRNQPRGILTLPWELLTGIPAQAPPSAAHR